MNGKININIKIAVTLHPMAAQTYSRATSTASAVGWINVSQLSVWLLNRPCYNFVVTNNEWALWSRSGKYWEYFRFLGSQGQLNVPPNPLKTIKSWHWSRAQAVLCEGWLSLIKSLDNFVFYWSNLYGARCQSDISWQRQMGDGTWGWSVCGLLADISRIKPGEYKRIRKEAEDYFNFPSSL